MANISQSMQASMLNWSLNVGTPTRPPGVFAGLANAAPTSVASSEIATATLAARQTMGFTSAGTPSGSGTATNTAAVTHGTFASVATVVGVFLADTVSSNAGTMLYFGNLAASRVASSGDSLVFASGALTITLN